MPHPIMFRDDDLGLAEVRKIALGFPEAFEKISHGRPAFFVSKMFVMYGGSAKTEPGASTSSTRTRSWSRSTRATARPRAGQPVLLPRLPGPSGWLGLDLTATRKVDWDEVGELIDASFRMVAPKKLIRLLDEV